MTGPVWVRWLLTALFLAIAAYCVLRLVLARRVAGGYPGCERAGDVASLVTSVGMAVMCSPVGGPLAPASWLTLFCLVAVWSLVRGRGGSPHHAMASAAMVYMLAAVPHDARHMSGPWTLHDQSGGGLAVPVLAWAFAAYFVGYAGWMASRAVRATGTPGVVVYAPRLAAGCELGMAVGMGYTLLAMA